LTFRHGRWKLKNMQEVFIWLPKKSFISVSFILC